VVAKDWSTDQYLKFADERTQPSLDLVNRILIENPQKIIDIGCGPGISTSVLAQRFPNAYILGIDNSPNMIETAKSEYPELDFLLCDAGKELDTLDDDFDIVFSNACIQWVPDHHQLLRNMMERLKPGGILAIQTPYNFSEPIQKVIEEVSSREKWAVHFNPSQNFHNLEEEEYYDLLAEISGAFLIWRTTYFHTMKSHQDIIEWAKGTGLRPYLNALSEEEQAAFLEDIHTELVKAYPQQKNGEIIFRFPRLFFTATPFKY